MRYTGLLTLIAALALAGCAGERSPAPTPAKKALAGKIYGNADAGRAAMERWCTGCHRATAPFADQAAPSLMQLAANADQSERAIRSFLMQPHSPMPPLELSNQMIEDIIAYLHRLAGK